MKKNILIPILAILGGAVFFIMALKGDGKPANSSISTSDTVKGFTKVNDKEAPDGYRTITAIDGVSFYVVQAAADSATAVSQISNAVSFDTDNYYSYKDGAGKYLLFNMSGLVVAAQKGTSFDFANNGLTEDTLGSSSVAGIWFDKSGNKLVADEDDNEFEIQANGGVVITNEIYGTYCGKLKVISDGTEEWSIFAGLQGEKYKDLASADKDIINNIVDSIHFAEHKEVETEVYAVSLGQSAETDEDIVKDLTNNDSQVSDSVQSETSTPAEADSSMESMISTENPAEDTEENTSGDNDIPTSSESDETQNEKTEESEMDHPDVSSDEDSSKSSLDETSQSISENDQSAANPDASEPADTKPEDSTEESETAESSSTDDTSINDEPVKVSVIKNETSQERGESLQLSNKRKIEKNADNAYSSNVYSMLEVGDSGIFSVLNVEKGVEETPIIHLEDIITGKAAEAVIKSYCATPEAAYEYFDPPNGCSWHLIKYSMNYKRCSSKQYVDIRLRGLDGGSLIHRGIKYSSMTHDLHIFAIENRDGWSDNLYCYYAVPNGCTNYALEIGGPISSDSKFGTAFYEINTKKQP
ncbi:MAG: hypothetical protein K2K56_11205 [Lachnospiraceae bacterium]|nr:hypothetical protein [Lachnospiraceae bacterium]